MYQTLLTFLENHPYWSLVITIVVIYIIVKLSRIGLLRQYVLHHVPGGILEPTLTIRWTGPVSHSDMQNYHTNVFTKTLLATRYGSTDFNPENLEAMMQINGYTNIRIEECQQKISGT
jgi:hypothetical protein